MSIASEQQRCPKCGGPIPAEAPQGLCPKCLLAEVSIPTEAGQTSKAIPPSRDELAAAFPHLEILELIGQGGMGFVFKARQPKLDRFVALKILSQSLAADPAFAERFTREGRVLARLSHPNIVAIHDFGLANGFFYLLMEFVDGVNLRQAMRAGRFTPDQALAIVPKICEALQYAHNEGILHRDIKPENILIDTKGRVKIADFGIAKLIGEAVGAQPSSCPDRLKPELQLTQAGSALGTPQYMAPEQIETPDAVDHRADIYSLGVVFYEMLTGELPLGRFAAPSEKSASDPRLDDVVFRTLEKEPSRRPQSAGEVKTQVETIATTPGSGTTKPMLPATLESHGALRPAVLALGLLLAGTLGTLLLMAVSHRHEMALIFGAAALVLALIFGVMSWRERLGKGVVIATLTVVVGLGITVTILVGGYALVARRAAAEAREQEKKERAETLRAREMEKPASIETWLPPLAPGEKPDLQQVLTDAHNLTKEGRHEEALQHHIWYHNHALEYGPGHTGVRLSFALSYWMELARHYPKAKQALLEIRDRGTREFAQGGGHFDLFMEVSCINEQLGERDATYALFKSIQSRDPTLASRCYFVAEDLLVEKGDYALCASFIPNFQERFNNIRMVRERTQTVADRTPQANQTSLRKVAEQTFIKDTRKLIEILVGVGRNAEAEKIREQAVAVLNVPELQSAIAEAEQKVAQHSPAGVESAGTVIPTSNLMRSLATRICDGDQSALDELRAIARQLYVGVNYTNDPGRVATNLFLMRAVFDVLGEQAGRSNAYAFSALQSSVFDRNLKGAATRALGISAAAGHEPSMDMLIHYRDWNILLSSTVFALRDAAEKNNDRAIQFLSEVVTNRSHRALWYGASQELRPAAAKGNAVAKAALEIHDRENPNPNPK